MQNHEVLDDHEARDNARDGRDLDVHGERGLVAYAGLVLLLLEEDYAYGEVECAGSKEHGLGIGDDGHQEGAESDKEGKPEGDGGDNRDFDLVVEDAHDMHVEEAHEPGNGVRGPHGEPDGDIGETAGDGDGGGDSLELGVLGVGAENTERGDHKDKQPVVKAEIEVEIFQHRV